MAGVLKSGIRFISNDATVNSLQVILDVAQPLPP